MRVALWGSYKHGNFGDDLMAVAFGRHIAERGHQPVVYQLDESIGAAHDLDIVGSMRELLDEADVCIIGGGAMLEAGPVRWVAREYARDLEREQATLWYLARRRGLPVHAISIGGSGGSRRMLLPPGRHLLFGGRVVRSATVRLPADEALLDALGVPAAYFPDVLLGATEIFESVDARRPASDRFRVGVNLVDRTGGALAADLLDWGARRPDVELTFIASHLSTDASRSSGRARSYEFVPPRGSSSAGLHRYSSVDETLAFLASLDVLVSSKLHLGVTALAFGVPFLSFAGRRKTAAFMATAGLAHWTFSSEDGARVLDRLESSRRAVEQGRSSVPRTELAPHLATLTAQSRCHLRHLDRILDDPSIADVGRAHDGS